MVDAPATMGSYEIMKKKADPRTKLLEKIMYGKSSNPILKEIENEQVRINI